MGRPSKFTVDRIEEVLRARRLGASEETAAAAGGVGKSTLRDWLDRGRSAPEGSRYHGFAEDWDAATAVPNVRALEIVNKAMIDKPELAWRFLERRERGYAPPAPQQPAVASGPVLIQLAFGNGAPTGEPVAGTVIDVKEATAGPRRLPSRSA